MSGAFAPGSRIGTYRLVEAIGNGGLGDVYRAVEEGSGKEAAFRVFAREVSDDAVLADRLRSLAPALRKLHHQHIGAVYELVTAGADLALFLEYVPGPTLDRLRQEPGRLDTHASIGCAVQVLRALEFAHGRGILHHAIRPANVIVMPGGAVKVMDFGIGHAFGANRKTREDRLLDVLAYLAPEQIQNMPGDARSDLYAVGVLLYELLTGRRPFDHRTEFALRQAHLNEPPASPRFLVPDLPEWLDRAVLRALAKHPTARYQNATEFRAVLEAALGLTTSREAAAVRSRGPSATDPFGAEPPVPAAHAGAGHTTGPQPAVPVLVQPTAQGTGATRSGAHRFAGPATSAQASQAARTSGAIQVPAPGGATKASRSRRGLFLALVLVVGVAAAGAYYWSRNAEPAAPEPSSTPAAAVPKARASAPAGTPAADGTADGPAAKPASPAPAPKPRARAPLAAKPLPPDAHLAPLAGGRATESGAESTAGAVGDPARDVSFHGVKHVTGTPDAEQSSDVVLLLGPDRLSVTPDGGGAALRSVRYRDLAGASYAKVERKRLGLISSTQHLLTIETASGPLLLRLDKDRVDAVLEALEARTGKAVSR